MDAHLTWTNGGFARVVSIGPGAIVVRSTIPSPPGSRIEGKLAGSPAATVRIKIHASRRQRDGQFLLEGRPLDLRRETRERLQATLRAAGPGDSSAGSTSAGSLGATDGEQGASDRDRHE